MTRPSQLSIFASCAALSTASAFALPAFAQAPAAGKGPAFKDAVKNFEEAKALLKKQGYRGAISDEELLQAAVEGMLRYADPTHQQWNDLMEPADYTALKNDLKGETVGIGVELRFDASTGAATVLGTGPDSPAAKAGIRKGDLILTVDGKGFQGKDFPEMVQAIRGPKDSGVKLTLLRNGEVLKKSLKRGVIPFDSVHLISLNGAAHMLRIPAFHDRTPQLVTAALEKFQAAGGKTLLIDLRHSVGGSLDRMVETAGLFLPKGSVVVTLRKEDGSETKQLRTSQAPVLGTGKKLAVLVGPETASGAEALAAALRLGANAKLVGAKTHGKWSVQAVQELPNGFVAKFTTNQMHAADGKTYEGKGMEPDLPVSTPELKDKEPEAGSFEAPNGKDLLEKDPVARAALAVLEG